MNGFFYYKLNSKLSVLPLQHVSRLPSLSSHPTWGATSGIPSSFELYNFPLFLPVTYSASHFFSHRVLLQRRHPLCLVHPQTSDTTPLTYSMITWLVSTFKTHLLNGWVSNSNGRIGMTFFENLSRWDTEFHPERLKPLCTRWDKDQSPLETNMMGFVKVYL